VAKSLEVYEAIPESAIVIVAHPDDAEFMVAGTVARWTRAGSRVVFLLVTDGDKGASDPNVRREDLAALRRAEQEAAANVLGVDKVEFLHYEDGMVEPTLTLRRDIARMIRKHRPSVAMCQDPTRYYSGRGYINHPDHRAVAEAALGAIYPAARDPLTFTELLAEGYEPHKVKEVFIGFTEDEDLIVDISDTIDSKAAALKAHRSQVGDWEPLDMLMTWAKGAADGQPFEYGETFRYIKMEDE
jgi:LmbE family N-acetylglucosaminyl deacetylase